MNNAAKNPTRVTYADLLTRGPSAPVHRSITGWERRDLRWVPERTAYIYLHQIDRWVLLIAKRRLQAAVRAIGRDTPGLLICRCVGSDILEFLEFRWGRRGCLRLYAHREPPADAPRRRSPWR